MIDCNILQHEIDQVASLLKINTKKLSCTNPNFKSPNYISQALKINAEKYKGGNKESEALMIQWLEERVSSAELLMKLNNHLLHCVYVVDEQLTVVDFLLFEAVKSKLAEHSQQEKQTTYQNVARWAAFIQRQIGRNNQIAIVMKNSYYNGFCHNKNNTVKTCFVIALQDLSNHVPIRLECTGQEFIQNLNGWQKLTFEWNIDDEFLGF